MWAGTALLDHIDHSLIEQHRDELPMLLEAANRRDLPTDVALSLIEHVKSHADVAFLPVLQKFGEHSDATVRQAAGAAAASVRQQASPAPN
jgi:hypothetical protein